MPLDDYTKDFFRGFRTKLETISAKLDALIAIADKPRQDDPKSIGNEEAPTDETYAAIGKILFSLYAEPAEQHTKEPERKWYKTSKWWKGAGRITKDVIEVMAFVFAIGYAVVTYHQWRDAARNFKTDERAWIQIDVVGVPPEENTPLVIGFDINNVGKTPAKKVTVQATTLMLKALEEVPHNGFLDVNLEYNVIFPNQKAGRGAIARVDKNNKPVILTHDEVDGFNKGLLYEAIYGVADYDDISGVHHRTYFCAAKSKAPVTASVSCKNMNDVDNNE